MRFKCVLPLAALAAIAVSTAALAQEAPAAAAPAAAAPSYSDSQMTRFAHATVELQSLGSQDATTQTRAIEKSGMTVEEYNRMGDDMRANPALAGNLNPYLLEANAERRARADRARDNAAAASYTPPPARHAKATKRSSSRHARVTRHSRSGHSLARSSTHHKSTKAALSRKASHKASSTRHAHAHAHAHAKSVKRSASGSHAAKRHKHKRA